VQVKQPYVVEELCNGCGICENVCPLEGKAGIDVFAVTTRTPLAETAESTPGQPASQPADPYAGGGT
jgi:ferredoxin